METYEEELNNYLSLINTKVNNMFEYNFYDDYEKFSELIVETQPLYKVGFLLSFISENYYDAFFEMRSPLKGNFTLLMSKLNHSKVVVETRDLVLISNHFVTIIESITMLLFHIRNDLASNYTKAINIDEFYYIANVKSKHLKQILGTENYRTLLFLKETSENYSSCMLKQLNKANKKMVMNLTLNFMKVLPKLLQDFFIYFNVDFDSSIFFLTFKTNNE